MDTEIRRSAILILGGVQHRGSVSDGTATLLG